MTSLEPILSKIPKKLQLRNASAPRQRRGYASSKIFFPFEIKKSGARKNKKCKENFGIIQLIRLMITIANHKFL